MSKEISGNRTINQREIFNPGESANIMTEEAYLLLQQSLLDAREKLAESQQAVGEAGGTSDWHDNFALEEAHRDIDLWSSVIRTKRAQLDDVLIIPARQEVDKVGLGNTVELKFEDEEEIETFHFLGPIDSTFRDSCISFKTPVGQQIIGQPAGKTVEIQVGDEVSRVEIVRILPGNFQTE